MVWWCFFDDDLFSVTVIAKHDVLDCQAVLLRQERQHDLWFLRCHVKHRTSECSRTLLMFDVVVLSSHIVLGVGLTQQFADQHVKWCIQWDLNP